MTGRNGGLLVVLVMAALMGVPGAAMTAENDFIVSFGSGGLVSYRVVDNTCYAYALNYPREEKQLSQLMNGVLTNSIAQARRQFAKENDGLLNVKVEWQFLGKEKVVYQVCGDIVRKGGN